MRARDDSRRAVRWGLAMQAVMAARAEDVEALRRIYDALERHRQARSPWYETEFRGWLQ